MILLIVVIVLLFMSQQQGQANPLSGIVQTIVNLVSGLVPGIDTATLGLFVALVALFFVFYHHHTDGHVRAG